MTSPSPSGGAPRTEKLYVIAGEARQEFGLLALRDRIRAGQLQRDDQVALAGTELWKPAWQYPALERYFALAQGSAAAGAPVAAVPSASMGSRVARGIVYPFTNIAAIAFILLTGVMAPIPLVASLFSLLSMVYAMAIIRKSAEGGVRAPEITAVGGAGEWVLSLLRLIAITLISGWPVIGALVLFFIGFRSIALFPIALVVMLLYYPACLATVAMFRSIGMALSVQRIFGFISALGADYYIAVGMAIVTAVVVAVATFGLRLVLPRLVTEAINGAATVWVVFYGSHLLGWALGLHRSEVAE